MLTIKNSDNFAIKKIKFFVGLYFTYCAARIQIEFN